MTTRGLVALIAGAVLLAPVLGLPCKLSTSPRQTQSELQVSVTPEGDGACDAPSESIRSPPGPSVTGH